MEVSKLIGHFLSNAVAMKNLDPVLNKLMTSRTLYHRNE